jgi:hypothetical protein
MSKASCEFVETKGGVWLSVGNTISYGDFQYGLIISISEEHVVVQHMKKCVKMRSNIPKTSKLYGLNYLILCPHIKKSVLVKDIISIIFVGNAFLFDKSFLSHHRGFENVFGIEQQLTWVTSKKNKKSLKLVDIADNLFMEGGPSLIYHPNFLSSK